MNSPGSGRKRKAAAAAATGGTFVWAREGNHETAKEHAAYLLQSCDVPRSSEGNNEDDYVYVRWTSTGTIQCIPKSNISSIEGDDLSHRRRRRRSATTTNDNTDSMATTTLQTTSQSHRDNNRRKSKLSLTKKQRQHWRDYHRNLQCTKQVERGQNNVSKDESKMTTQHDNLDDVKKSKSSQVDNINDVDDDNDIINEEKKEDDIETKMQRSKSPILYDRIQMKEGNSIIEKLQQHPKTSYIEERQVPTETKTQQSQQQDHSAEKMIGEKTETAERKQLYTPRSSAYVQHLSEACNIIMSDGRWRTIKTNETSLSSKETTLFSWEEGDDLSAVKAFMSLYEEDNANDEMEDEEKLNKIEDENTIVFERSMNLYSRIYHRKGPWFDISDLYVRYYAPQLSETTDEETKRTQYSMSNQQAALQRLFTDIVRLESMGLVRTFKSEYECGTVSGKMSASKRGVLLSAEERNQVLRLLGGGKSPKAAKVVSMPNQSNNCTNEILAQMQSQKTLFSATAHKATTTTSLLPVRKHVNKVLLRKLAMKMIMLSKTKEDQARAPKRGEVEMTQQMIESVWENVTKDSAEPNKSNILSTIRLREAPLQTLRRVMRLFLCAGGGPGSMRGDGTNGWRTCYETADSWHKVEYPGLNLRLGLQSYPLQKYFVDIHAHNASTRVFESLGEFRLFEIGAELRSSIDALIEGYERDKMARRRKEKDQAHSDENQTDVVCTDVFQLLTRKGRQNLVQWVLSCISPTNESALLKICTKIEDDVRHLNELYGSIGGNESVILHTSIVCRWILQYRIDNSSTSLSARPWLRHLSFDAILTYIVWDGIPFLEKRDLYVMASSTLATILFGTSVQNFSFDCFGGVLQSNQSEANSLIRYLLPRRNRGKAMERLLIDLTHAYRKEKKEKANSSTPLDLSPIQECCRSLLGGAAISCSIPFSSIRNLARRLKAPLIRTMDGISNDEMRTLQIRLDNVNSDSDDLASCTSYRDWSAKTDLSIANALSNDRNESAAGKRCAFVGWESFDGDNYSENTRSLNVEELALEEYNAGRLPNADDENDSNILRGNWEGWHDEGGHARKLFRTIFLQQILLEHTNSESTIFLTPYQQSPHDLHVGYQKVESGERKEVSSIPGFYERRYSKIEAFLSKLSRQTDQELSDLVHECIKTRWDSHANDESRVKDLPLMKDVLETRTLSMIAAGIGGKTLAAVFRAFAFDYRHYSGGLPDLLLTRARHLSSADSAENHFVDLGEWVGEAFCKDHIEEEKMNRSIGMLADRDDDFLGCSKQADAISSRSKFSSLKRRQKISVLPEFPDKLQLIHNHAPVKVECMFVEVKSSNDRLDSRQEDWLNIIDSCGSARVCKFGSKKQSK